MAAPAIPERVLVTTTSLHIFEEDKKNTPYDIPEEYRLEWRKPFWSGADDQGTIILAILGYEEADIPNKIKFELGRNAWVTPKEATDVLIGKLANEAAWLFNYGNEGCTEWIAKVHGDTDALLRDAGISHTLGRLISTYEGRAIRHLGKICMLYSALLHQQCDLEHELKRREQGLIKED